MRVKYKINKTIYNALIDIMSEAKETEDIYDMAEIITTDNETIYLTCCKNKWFVGFDGNHYYFGYEGTRNGFIRVQPFHDSRYGVPRFYLDYPSEPYLRKDKWIWICIRKDYLKEADDNDTDIRKVTPEDVLRGFDIVEEKEVKFNYVCYELRKLLEYETTLPKNIVHPLDTIDTLLTNDKIAVVLHGKHHVYPLMIVKYKNMYKKKKRFDLKRVFYRLFSRS
ncbi:MAG: hypothetical protein QXQ91_05075 [Nanopusillaceae archaeon]